MPSDTRAASASASVSALESVSVWMCGGWCLCVDQLLWCCVDGLVRGEYVLGELGCGEWGDSSERGGMRGKEGFRWWWWFWKGWLWW